MNDDSQHERDPLADALARGLGFPDEEPENQTGDEDPNVAAFARGLHTEKVSER